MGREPSAVQLELVKGNMSQSISRVYWVLAWSLAVLGIVLLTWWAIAVSAYGVEVDENALAPTVRPGDVALFSGGVLCLVLAVALPLLRRRKSK